MTGRAPLRTARIIGLGHKLPDRVVGNTEIAERIGVDSDWIVRRTGIRERRYAGQDERTTDLALAAARRALTDADTRPSEIDLVLVATMTPDELTPNTAPLLAHALGIGVGAYDVGAACTGWLSALSAGAAQVETGRAEPRARRRRRDPLAHRRPRRTSAPRCSSATAPPPSCSAPTATARSARSSSSPTAR